MQVFRGSSDEPTLHCCSEQYFKSSANLGTINPCKFTSSSLVMNSTSTFLMISTRKSSMLVSLTCILPARPTTTLILSQALLQGRLSNCLALFLEGCQTSPVDPAPHGPDLGWWRHRVGLVSLRCISQGSRQTNDRGLLLEQSDNFRSYNSPKVCPEARSSHRCCRLGCLITTEVIKYLWPYIAHD